MGCGASKAPQAAVPAAAPEPSLTRKPSAPVIKIEANVDPVLSPGSAAPSQPASDPVVDQLSKDVTPTSVEAARHIPVGDVVSKVSKEGGVKGVLALMKEHATDAEYQWWCCDAIASLCAGSEENRSAVYVAQGVLAILGAMKVFAWDENVLTKGNWALANMAAGYSDYVGKQGGVEAVVAGMRACPEAYQVQISGARALQNLVTGSDANRVRAVHEGAQALLTEALERNPEDGQLQWRGQQLLEKLATTNETDVSKHSANLEVARNSPWNKVRSAVIAGHARRIARGMAQFAEQFGPGAKVGEVCRKEGIVGVLRHMKEQAGHPQVEMWCCDAIFTECSGREEKRKAAAEAGAVDLIFTAMKANTWEEELQLKAFWALLALAPSHTTEIGGGDHMATLVAAMYANKTNHQIQVAAVKLMSLLCIDPTGTNLRLAKEANAARIVKSTIAAHSEDGQLQYRGVNLLEKLEPGCTDSMPKQKMIRSYSMRAEEMVSQYRISAKSFMSQNTASRDTGMESRSNAAIAEVDEMAEAVEEHEGKEADDKAAAERKDGEPAGNLPGTVVNGAGA